MLSNSALEYYKKIVLFAGALNLFPYKWKWDKMARKFKVEKTTWSQIIFWAQTAVLLLFQLILVIRALNLAFDKSVPNGKKFGVLRQIFTYVGMTFAFMNTLVNYDKFPLLVNSFIDVPRKFDTLYGNGKKSDGKVKESTSKAISYIIIPGYIFAVLNLMAAFKRPDSLMLLTSLAAEPQKIPLIIRISYFFFHSYLQFLQYTKPMFHLVTVVCYVDAVLPMIKSLSITNEKMRNGKVEVETDLSQSDLYHYYHELRILQRIFNGSYSYWALGCQTFLTVFCTANIFHAGALHNIRGIFAAMAQMILIKVIFRHLALVYEISAPTLQSWKEISGEIWFKKFKRSCQPFRVVVGSFYFADNTLILTMIALISTNAGSMIVAYKDA